MKNKKTIKIDGIEYVQKDTYVQEDTHVQKNIHVPAQKLNGLKYVIVRTYSAGVFAGYLDSRNGQEVVLLNARRLWYWEGAASLSQLAMNGVKKPKNCKFPCEVDRVELLEAIEVIDCTEEAKLSIANVKIWQE